MAYNIVVGSYNDSVYTLTFDGSKSGADALSLSSTLPVGYHPSWVDKHPSDPSLVFTVLEQPEGLLLALRYDVRAGTGKIIASIPTGGHSPCSILVMEEDILVGNYMAGTVGCFKILKTDSGDITLIESQQPLRFTGSGPCKERQESSHPHQVYLVKNGKGAGRDVLVPDLGSDRIYRLSKEASGSWTVSETIPFDAYPGGGPRHVIVEDEKLFTLLELTSQVVVHNISKGKPELITDVRLPMPSDLAPLTMLAAEILLPSPNKSFPDRLLYVSNRNDPRDHGDLISIYSVESQGLELVGTVPTGLNHVRGFIFFGPEDRYCIAGGANGGGVKIFERTDGGKNMTEISHLPAIGGGVGLAPTSFVCL